jgi:hypothetical protein
MAKHQKLRHGATTSNQEYERDVEMREAAKAAEERAGREWSDRRPHFPFTKGVSQQIEAWERENGSLDQWKAAARVAAREDLRARWAREDAERATPLAPHVTRITPEELRKIESLNAKREAYVAEVRTLDVNGRKDELRRLVQALGLAVDDVG